MLGQHDDGRRPQPLSSRATPVAETLGGARGRRSAARHRRRRRLRVACLEAVDDCDVDVGAANSATMRGRVPRPVSPRPPRRRPHAADCCSRPSASVSSPSTPARDVRRRVRGARRRPSAPSSAIVRAGRSALRRRRHAGARRAQGDRCAEEDAMRSSPNPSRGHAK